MGKFSVGDIVRYKGESSWFELNGLTSKVGEIKSDKLGYTIMFDGGITGTVFGVESLELVCPRGFDKIPVFDEDVISLI